LKALRQEARTEVQALIAARTKTAQQTSAAHAAAATVNSRALSPTNTTRQHQQQQQQQQQQLRSPLSTSSSGKSPRGSSSRPAVGTLAQQPKPSQRRDPIANRVLTDHPSPPSPPTPPSHSTRTTSKQKQSKQTQRSDGLSSLDNSNSRSGSGSGSSSDARKRHGAATGAAKAQFIGAEDSMRSFFGAASSGSESQF
jgi:hypothetical protein